MMDSDYDNALLELDDLVGVSTEGPDYEKIKQTLEIIQKNLFELQFTGETELNGNQWNDIAKTTDSMIDSILKELDDDCMDTIRMYAMKAHVAVLRANLFIEEKEYDEARQVLNDAETLLEPYAQDPNGVYVYIEVLLGKGRSYYTEELFTLALTYFRKAEFAYNEFKGHSKNAIELFGLENYVDVTDKLIQEKWSIVSLKRLIIVSLFTCYVMKNNDTAMIKYAIPSLQAKVELSYLNGERCTALEVATKILDLVDVFISNHYFQQADHLLSVAAFNLEKERTHASKNEEKLRELDKHECVICNKYAWLGYLILKGSMMYQEMKSKEKYGLPPTCDELRNLEIHLHCVRLPKLVGAGFAKFENQMPHVYITDPDEIQEVLDTTKAWIRKGHCLSDAQENRSKFICIMEDVLHIERKMKKTVVPPVSANNKPLQLKIRFK